MHHSGSLDVGREELIALLDLLPDMIVLTDLNGRIRYLNSPARRGSEENVQGSHVFGLLAPGDRAVQEERFARVAETGAPERYEVPVARPDGTHDWYEGVMRPVRVSGRLIGVLFVTRDITERHRGQAALEALSRLVPVCSWCHRVQGGEGRWRELEAYIEESQGGRVTHGVCPRCADTIDIEGAGPA